MNQHKENIFENEVIDLLKANGYDEGTSQNYNKALALYPSDLIAYIKTTSSKAYGSKDDENICKRVAKQMDAHGSLHFLRNEVKDRGGKFKLC